MTMRNVNVDIFEQLHLIKSADHCDRHNVPPSDCLTRCALTPQTDPPSLFGPDRIFTNREATSGVALEIIVVDSVFLSGGL